MVPYFFFLVHNDLCILILMYMFIFCRATVLFLDCIKYGNLMILRTWLLTFVKKKDSYPFFKKDAIFVVCIYFFHIFQKEAILQRGHLPPGYLPGYLMLPNLTNHFIKLSDGDLQCEWNSDIFLMDEKSYE